jgi:putative FmdB family regulatory protein
MPIYEYKCGNGHHFEVVQRMTDDPVSACEQCGEPVERVFHPIAVHFKGSGFYTTDYARRSNAASPESSTESKKTDAKDAGSKSGEAAKASSSSD